MPYDKFLVVFSHYALYVDDIYDHQGSGLIQMRKEKIQALLEGVNKNTPEREIINIHGHLHSHLAPPCKEVTHVNACLERTRFYPVKLKDLLHGIT